MITKSRSFGVVRGILLLAAVLDLSVLLAFAAPNPEPVRSPSPAETPSASSSGKAGAMRCSACKTVVLADSLHADKSESTPPEKGIKHDCDRCGGSIIAVRGAAINCMLHRCPACGEAANLCNEAIQLAMPQARRP